MVSHWGRYIFCQLSYGLVETVRSTLGVSTIVKAGERHSQAGQVHVNGMENFWSLLKRGLKGGGASYLHVAK